MLSDDIFSLDNALKHCFDRQMFGQMVEFFFAERDEWHRHMRAALADGDMAAIARIAHRLRGTVVYLGAAAALAAAEQVELAGMANQQDRLANLLAKLEEQLEQALQPHRNPPEA